MNILNKSQINLTETNEEIVNSVNIGNGGYLGLNPYDSSVYISSSINNIVIINAIYYYILLIESTYSLASFRATRELD